MNQPACDMKTVQISQAQRPGQNRYRLNCTHYVDCGCVHSVGSHVYCVACGEARRVTNSAISVWMPVINKWRCVYDHEERDVP